MKRLGLDQETMRSPDRRQAESCEGKSVQGPVGHDQNPFGTCELRGDRREQHLTQPSGLIEEGAAAQAPAGGLGSRGRHAFEFGGGGGGVIVASTSHASDDKKTIPSTSFWSARSGWSVITRL